MKTSIKTSLSWSALMLFAATTMIAIVPRHVAAATTTAKSSPTISVSSATTSKTSDVTYKYVAQAGDSYTLFARKAIETYGIKYKTKITPNRIIYTETNMTIEAGSPYLDEGQQENISEATVKSWVTKALALSDDQAAAWDVYVPTVDFNTNQVGQAS